MIGFEWANASSVEEAVKLLKPAAAADRDEMPRAIAGGHLPNADRNRAGDMPLR